jgi:hypothetical protein
MYSDILIEVRVERSELGSWRYSPSVSKEIFTMTYIYDPMGP